MVLTDNVPIMTALQMIYLMMKFLYNNLEICARKRCGYCRIV